MNYLRIPREVKAIQWRKDEFLAVVEWLDDIQINAHIHEECHLFFNSVRWFELEYGEKTYELNENHYIVVYEDLSLEVISEEVFDKEFKKF